MRPSDIVAMVEDEFELEPDILYGPKRSQTVRRARSMTMKILQDMGMSYPEIGEAIGRDHSTVITALKRFDPVLDSTPRLHITYERLKKRALYS